MRPCLIEILRVGSQGVHQMGSVEDDDPIKALFAHRTHPTFSIRIGAWRSKWRVNDCDAFRLEDSVEALTIFPIIVTDEMGEGASFGVPCPHELTRLLGPPKLGGMRCRSHDVDP